MLLFWNPTLSIWFLLKTNKSEITKTKLNLALYKFPKNLGYIND
jgi:hypothetical protein